MLAWLDDVWSQRTLQEADDAAWWLAAGLRAVLVQADAGQVSDDEPHAAIGVLSPSTAGRDAADREG